MLLVIVIPVVVLGGLLFGAYRLGYNSGQRDALEKMLDERRAA